MKPSYLATFKTGKLKNRADQAFELLETCTLCPRKCKVNRLKGEQGFCKTGLLAQVYSFMPHHGEEPPISGERGSGTIFFAHCNMACVYCQNYEFSQQEGLARETDAQELANIMLELQRMGCHNINLVTPTHVMPQILQALLAAIPAGLSIPLVYNTSGYELPEMIALLEGIVDIYLPDARYANDGSAEKYSHAPQYPRYNQQSLKAMHCQAGIAQLNKQGILEKGMVIRHLVLPHDIANTREVMRFIAQELSPDTYISLMSQYMPCYQSQTFSELNRRISLAEYGQAQEAMHEFGLSNGWTQEAGGLDRFAGTNIKPAFEK